MLAYNPNTDLFDLLLDGADENVTLHHCATPQPCGEDMFTCENGRCINKVSAIYNHSLRYLLLHKCELI